MRGRTNRGLQTSGYATQEFFCTVLQECDLLLFDLKLCSTEEHQRYTGVPNERILENYRIAAGSGVRLLTRIPLIPGVTDTEKNIEGICRIMQKSGIRYAELLPYNRMAGSKYPLAGRIYTPPFDANATPHTRQEIFAAYGIDTRIL